MKSHLFRRQWLLFSIALLVLFLIGLSAWGCWNSLFPMAPPLPLPEEAQVLSITVTHLSGEAETITNREAIQEMMAVLSQAVPTRELSVQDFPSVSPYGCLELRTREGSVTIYFYYEKADTLCLELPYTGIYHTQAKPQDGNAAG